MAFCNVLSHLSVNKTSLGRNTVLAFSFRRLFAGVAFAALLVSLPFAAHAGVLSASVSVGGQSQGVLSENYWSWLLNDGVQADQGTVIFPAIGATSPDINRTDGQLQVMAGKPLFMLLNGGLNILELNNPECLLETDPAACALAPLAAFLENPQDLLVRLDGQVLVDLSNTQATRRVSTTLFTLTLADTNPAGIPGGVYSAASYGYWAALEGLSAGEHTLEFGGADADGWGAYSTLRITAVPVPGSVWLCLLGLMLYFAVRRGNQLVQYAAFMARMARVAARPQSA
jgi:hypothetical protein